MVLSVLEIKYTFIACLVEMLFQIEVEQTINKDVKYAIFLIAIFTSIAKVVETQK